MSQPVRVRFAPSPTGALHVGGARTAIYNWAFARRHGGAFILRIDDTDPERSTPENTAQILRSLKWLGLDWDEGPEVGGPYGPYFQTQRAANYAAALERLKARGATYPCFCSAQELEAKRASAQEGEGTRGYDRTCRRLDPDVVAARLAAGEPHVWRLAVPENRGEIVFDDAVRGHMVFPAEVMDDFVLVRADGTPTYNFATVVDDADMEITHVIRGDDHLSNTPRQILVYEALGRPVPVFAHLPMIWGPDGKKLSKRHGAASVEAFRDQGFLPEALLNYLALLGWSLDGETTIIPAAVLIREFSLERISKNPAIFDFEKLEWMNGVYLRELSAETFAERMFPWIVSAGLAPSDDLEKRRDWYVALAPLVQARVKRLCEVAPLVQFLFGREVELDPASVQQVLANETAPGLLKAAHDALARLESWTAEAADSALRKLAEDLETKPRTLFQMVRVAVTGTTVSLPLFESIALLGREVTLARLRTAQAVTTGSPTPEPRGASAEPSGLGAEPSRPSAPPGPQPAGPDGSEPLEERHDFIRDWVRGDLASGRVDRVVTRFPPEPNGYLHIGHAKSICLNFGIAREFGGQCNLRMDDTNPTKEDVEYVDSITEDVKWLIAGWADHCLGLKPLGVTPEKREINGRTDYYLPAVVRTSGSRSLETSEASSHSVATAPVLEPFYASDYFEALYDFAVQLIRKGRAYVCDHTAEEVDKMRGAPDRPGQESLYRNRSIEENLDLFARMRAGEFPDGARTLRAKIDMRSPNVWLRDPVLYRIRHTSHHHTGDRWCIYPTYDFAHCLSDYIEGVTHSICTLEFEVHRPLYDWILEALDLPRPLPQQREFARLNLTYTVMSKRKLLRLVQEGHVTGWDDPRMPTIAGMRRRGYPAEAIRTFCQNIGVAKRESTVQLEYLEHFVREHLNRWAPRVMAVLRPLRVVIENYPEGQVEEMEAVNNPEDPSMGVRKVPFSRVLYIEQDDFRETPPPKYYRLSPGTEVRLRYAYLVTCTGVVKDPATGEVLEVRVRYDPATRGGNAPDGRKVKSTIHWVSAEHALEAEVRLYDTLFAVENPDEVPEGEDFTRNLNPYSLEVLKGCKLEPSLALAMPGITYQFERLGYFCLDAQDSRPGAPVFNRTATLKDTWAKIEKKQALG